MKGSLERKWIAGGFGLALFLMTGVSFASYRNTIAITENANHVQQTYDVLNQLATLYAELLIAESGRRGYVFLNNQQELERYQLAVAKIHKQLQVVQSEIHHTSIRQKQYQHLVALINQRLELLQQSIVLHQTEPTAIAAQNLITENSIRLRDQIQTRLTEITAQEKQELAASIDQSEATIRRKTLLELIGILLSIAAIAGACFALYHQQMQRQKVELLEGTLAQEKELNQLKLRFFSMVSHEFRTPLSVILASSQLLEEILQELVDESKLKNLQRIQVSARLMNQLLTDILTLSRAEAGELEFKPAPLDIEAFCLNLLEDIQASQAMSHSLQFVSQGRCTRVNLDEKLIYSILSNLLLNAVKYSPQGSSIYLSLICKPDATIFQVKDEGIGIPLEEQQKIFAPFYRGQNVNHIVGTGLGLAVVKTCLALHQGEIAVSSEATKGTVFTVTIPALGR
ncbi:histidine kinase [Leptolyngbya sp. NK1-12]|uniref:histidine kinase n=1 Tax=Leptolyngbya sp. NK1-12 TaxID=2547451 RepID=A0AA96WQC9_9CYAN|nr:histidine kinase [Leptolyngbya sp. NK1-12]